jgi:hypothetical protein
VHRAQITFDALDTDTGEMMRGRIDAGADGPRQGSPQLGWARRSFHVLRQLGPNALAPIKQGGDPS